MSCQAPRQNQLGSKKNRHQEFLIREATASNKRPFRCVRSSKRLNLHWSRGSGKEKMQRRAESVTHCLFFAKEDFGEIILPNCF